MTVESLPWNPPLEGLLRQLRATHDGLSNREAKRRLAEYGPNDALIRRRRPLWRQILDRRHTEPRAVPLMSSKQAAAYPNSTLDSNARAARCA